MFYIMTKTVMIMKHRKLSQALLWLSENEWHARHKKLSDEVTAEEQAAMSPNVSPDGLSFDDYDINKDGVITREEFEAAAERLYLQDPMKVRFTTKYDHSKGCLVLKMTDNAVCLQYKTEVAQDIKKCEKFVNNLMRHMASKEQH